MWRSWLYLNMHDSGIALSCGGDGSINSWSWPIANIRAPCNDRVDFVVADAGFHESPPRRIARIIPAGKLARFLVTVRRTRAYVRAIALPRANAVWAHVVVEQREPITFGTLSVIQFVVQIALHNDARKVSTKDGLAHWHRIGARWSPPERDQFVADSAFDLRWREVVLHGDGRLLSSSVMLGEDVQRLATCLAVIPVFCAYRANSHVTKRINRSRVKVRTSHAAFSPQNGQ